MRRRFVSSLFRSESIRNWIRHELAYLIPHGLVRNVQVVVELPIAGRQAVRFLKAFGLRFRFLFKSSVNGVIWIWG